MSKSIERRQFHGATTAAGLSAWLGSIVGLRPAWSADAGDRSRTSPYRRCITLWMSGGPSQLETFDPKPGTETGGPMKSVPTSVPGLHFCETLSQLASRAEDLCVLRSIGSNQGEHDRASYLLHTGFERIDSFPRPSLGAFASHRQGRTVIPGFVTLGSRSYGPAFLGREHGPFVVSDRQATLETLRRVARQRDRIELISELNRSFGARSQPRALAERADQIDAVRDLLGTPFGSALDVAMESAETRRRYGENEFAQSVLAARRLLEAGVSYVEVQMPGWDTHVGNFTACRRLCRQLEPAWIALMDDLKSNGLWEDTLILWMGEFGRTPKINGQSGRDHHPQSIPVALAGHSFDGQAIGSTGRDGRDRDEKPIGVADLMYTLLTLLGVDAAAERTTEFGSPTNATDDGSLITEILPT